jgi:hypothetical protein
MASGLWKFGEVSGTPMQREPILFQNLKYPPGVWMGPLPLTRRVWFGVAPNADPDQPRPWLASVAGCLSEHGLPGWSRSLAVEINLDKALAAFVKNAHGQAVKTS